MLFVVGWVPKATSHLGESCAGVVPLGFEVGDDFGDKFALQAVGVVVCERSGPVRGFAGLIAVAANPLQGLNNVDQLSEWKVLDRASGKIGARGIVANRSPVRRSEFIKNEGNIEGVSVTDRPIRASAHDPFDTKMCAQIHQKGKVIGGEEVATHGVSVPATKQASNRHQSG